MSRLNVVVRDRTFSTARPLHLPQTMDSKRLPEPIERDCLGLQAAQSYCPADLLFCFSSCAVDNLQAVGCHPSFALSPIAVPAALPLVSASPPFLESTFWNRLNGRCLHST